MTYIHQVAISDDDINGYVSPNRENIKEFLPEFEYKFWDLPGIKKLLNEDGATEVIDAIDQINGYALKADIARYYLAYRFGGWYVDLNNYFTEDPSFLNDASLVVFAEVQQTAGTTWGVQNSLFYSTPKHEVFKKTVDMCIENVKAKYYGFTPWCPTGPNLLGSALASQKLSEGHGQRYGKVMFHEDSKYRGFYIGRTTEENVGLMGDPITDAAAPDILPIVLWKPYNFSIGESGLPGGNNYIKMWDSKTLYS